ncbi:TlpA family protein disulfide reductase, partial [Candidatus Berkelbacteria bacterium]|nr:TlpA family protein disulfide reductase [Candidatus Berkelbacteria bacterium]
MKYLLFGLAAVLIISGFYFFLTNRSSNQAVTTEKSDQELASASQEFEGVAEFEDEPAPIDNQEAEPIAYPTNLTLTLRDGTQVALADFQGQKAVVLDFWASWCHNCQRNMP